MAFDRAISWNLIQTKFVGLARDPMHAQQPALERWRDGGKALCLSVLGQVVPDLLANNEALVHFEAVDEANG